jgi:hypothetical protein
MIRSVHILVNRLSGNGRASRERRSARGSPKLAQSQQQAGLTSHQREVYENAFAESSKGRLHQTTTCEVIAAPRDLFNRKPVAEQIACQARDHKGESHA